ncbi:MAG: tetratricopeptide repeat protein [Bacteroidales bacterium]|jgi:tetratricopeptide (TPR) repeat protein
MGKYKRLIIYVSTGILSVGIVLMMVRIVLNASYRHHIPALPDFTSLSVPVREQLTIADRKARHNPTADFIGMLGMVYHSCAYYDQASQCYKLAIKGDKSKWLWDYYLGLLDQEMGDSRSASENFIAVIRKKTDAYMALYYLGKAYENMTMNDLAESTLRKVASLQDNVTAVRTIRVNYSSLPITAKFELARIYLNSGRLDEAEELLAGIIRKNHRIGPVYRLLGNVFNARGDTILGSKLITRAKDLPDISPVVDTLYDKLILISRSESYLPKQIDDAIKSANPEWALKLLNIALQYFPEDKYLISKSIKFFFWIGSGNEGIHYLNMHLDDFRDDFAEINEVGQLLFKKGFYTQAMRYYARACHLKPENNEARASLALCYLRAGEKDTASVIMKELFDKNRNDPRVLANEVDFFLRSDEKSMAKMYLEKLRNVAPSDPKVSKLAGMIAESEGNPKMAMPLYEDAFRKDPSDLETAQKLEYLLLKQKSWDKAIGILRISLKYNPNESFLLEKLGTLLVTCPDQKFSNIEEGMEFSERAFYNISSHSVTIITAGKSLAIANALLGDFQTAAFYMNIILNMARNEKVPQEYFEELVKLAGAIKRMGAIK